MIVGAGLAGLSAARELCAHGLDVLLLEAAAKPGGRLQTDFVDGFALDRGFQVINPAYPRIRRLGPLDGISFHAFAPGLSVATVGATVRLADPVRRPGWATEAISPRTGGILEKLRFGRYALSCATSTPTGRTSGTDLASDLAASGISGRLYTDVIRPFLTGIFLADPSEVSSAYGRLVIRSLIRGTPALPTGGVAELPMWIAGKLPEGVLLTSTPVVRVRPGLVTTEDDSYSARAVIVATDLKAGQQLGLPAPRREMVACTTWYFAAPASPGGGRSVLVDATTGGPVINTAVLSDVVPDYSPDGRALVQATTLGLERRGDFEREIRNQLTRMWRTSVENWDLIDCVAVPDALPLHRPGAGLVADPSIGDGMWLAGDYLATPSQQGAMASGARAAAAVLKTIGGPTGH